MPCSSRAEALRRRFGAPRRLWWAWAVDWDALLADLESRFEAERRAELAAHSAEMAEAEVASVALIDRLRGAIGRPLHLWTRSGLPVQGTVVRVHPSYLLIDEGSGIQAIVPTAAIATLLPLPGPVPSSSRHRPALGSLLREIARRGARVRLVLASGDVVGRIVRVGADHLDVVLDAEGGPRAARAPLGGPAHRPAGAVTSVVLGAVEVLRSR
ncbi:Fis family transcriptional regulator [Actinomyces capricornis]|uniref:Fis family transcriptional regulator n=1 Tax=Actinomyces capricornis TaxID=2755559 RepID=UPI001CC5108C|nr:Fis family transcriptional regulator [Actinomyces capricornis]